jgi:ubiquinone/menaquinone biosynthesis C-methylase UbiE
MEVTRQAINCCDIQPNDTVLEIGFGHGYGIIEALGKNAGKVYGLDFSKDMVKRAGKLLKEQIAAGKVELFHGAVAHAPFPNEKFDKIYAVNVIYFWEKPEQELAEILRLLKPGGRAVFYFTDRESINRHRFTQSSVFHKYTGEEFCSIVKNCGFSKVECETRENEQSPGNFGHCVIAYR